MGPQIPTPTVEADMDIDVGVVNDPLEFASSCLILYGVPTSEDFTSIQSLISTIAARLNLTVRCIFRASNVRGHSFWFEMESMDHARRMRTYMHHRRENGLELLVNYANYDDYVRTLARSTHRWPESVVVDVNQLPLASPLRPPAAETSARKSTTGDRYRP